MMRFLSSNMFRGLVAAAAGLVVSGCAIAAPAPSTNLYVHAGQGVTIGYPSTNIAGSLRWKLDDTEFEYYDGTYWLPLGYGYWPENRQFPEQNLLDVSASIRGGSSLNTLSYGGANFEPSGLFWHKGLRKLIVVGDSGDIAYMDYDGGNKTCVHARGNLTWTGKGSSTLYDFEAVTVVDETDLNFIYIGVERAAPNNHAMIIKCRPDNLAGNVHTFWDIHAAVPYVSDANQNLEGLTWIPAEDYPTWLTNYWSHTPVCTNGSFLVTRQSDGKFFLLDVPITNTPSATPYVLTTNALLYSWYPTFNIRTPRTDVADIHWDRQYKVLYAVVDEDGSYPGQPLPGPLRGLALYLYSMEDNRCIDVWRLPEGDETENPEGLAIGEDRGTVFIANDWDTGPGSNVYRWDLQVRGEHDLRARNVVMHRAPDADDDVSLGYTLGSRWTDSSGSVLYICSDATDGAAVWRWAGPYSGDDITTGTVADVRIASTIARDSEVVAATNALWVSATNALAPVSEPLSLHLNGDNAMQADLDAGNNGVTNLNQVVIYTPYGTTTRMYHSGSGLVVTNNGTFIGFYAPTLVVDRNLQVNGALELSLNCGGNIVSNAVFRGDGTGLTIGGAVPVATNSVGIPGQVAYTTNHFYVCVLTNTWRRAELTAW